jgi:drug/metabolite transporter (DMT)-like permease
VGSGAGPDPAVLAPLGAALCYGVAAVIQQVGAQRAATPPFSDAAATPTTRRLGLRLVFDLLRQPLFLAGLGLDAVGFFLAFVGLRHLPVFVVQAAVSSTVAVTAVLGSRFLGDRLQRPEWALVGAVIVGLTLVGASAADGGTPELSRLGTTLLIGGVPALGLAGLASDRRSAAALGALSGVGFGGFALAGRLMSPHDGLSALLVDPVLWAAVGYAVLGLGIYGAALQRGSVTAVTATTIATEALFPSAVGWLLLADGTRPGMGGAAAAGFALTVGGALLLAVSKSGATDTGTLASGCESVVLR